MHCIARGLAEREDATRLLPGARTALVAAVAYDNGEPDSRAPRPARAAWVSRYALGDGHHEVVRARLEAWISSVAREYPGATFRCYVATGPVPEPLLAGRAGRGRSGNEGGLTA